MVYDINNLVLAHKNARKGKSFYTEVKMVDSNPAKYLYELQEAQKNGMRFLNTLSCNCPADLPGVVRAI